MRHRSTTPHRQFIPHSVVNRQQQASEFNLASEFLKGKREENPNLGYDPLTLPDYARMVELVGRCARVHDRSAKPPQAKCHDPDKTLPSTPRGDTLFLEGALELLEYIEDGADHDFK